MKCVPLCVAGGEAGHIEEFRSQRRRKSVRMSRRRRVVIYSADAGGIDIDLWGLACPLMDAGHYGPDSPGDLGVGGAERDPFQVTNPVVDI